MAAEIKTAKGDKVTVVVQGGVEVAFRTFITLPLPSSRFSHRKTPHQRVFVEDRSEGRDPRDESTKVREGGGHVQPHLPERRVRFVQFARSLRVYAHLRKERFTQRPDQLIRKPLAPPESSGHSFGLLKMRVNGRITRYCVCFLASLAQKPPSSFPIS